MNFNKSILAKTTTAAIFFSFISQASAVNIDAGDFDANIYGYARLTMVYDVDEDIGADAENSIFSFIEGSGATGHFGANANQSRIGVQIKNNDGVEFKVEGDFYNGTLRLRHAYGQYKGILAGQNWSNYTSFVGATSTLDFSGVAGGAGLQHREPQLRYTTGKLSMSVENPRSVLNSANGATLKDSAPAFTARYESRSSGGGYSLGVLAKQNAHDDGITDDSAIAYAGFVSGKLALSDNISVQGSVNYSNGASAYLHQSYADDAYLDASGSLENISGYAGNIGTTFKLGGGKSINMAVGMTTVDWDDAVADGINVDRKSEVNRNILVNYLWTPVKNVMMGVELANWYTERVDGTDDDANRVMFAAQYNF
ncbi:DcaP family trimeric outer membrane transporter [Marinobacter sp. 71-i]|uniref:DcaP family trimeric outer membrane transporter n=1 Tax=Marinobacter iranensis TaxID=2962607 RepID=A0ABT5YB48_9GAMM|nr:DcaP family trimeric outer membrane transporter [Marinobacter iranensis]MDF0750837.1 DcaP family trimeric outer membrane transporter [Marinobacter iranensis]